MVCVCVSMSLNLGKHCKVNKALRMLIAIICKHVHINGEWKITGNYMENKHVILRGTLYVNGKKKICKR